MKIKIANGGGAAWRARYLSINGKQYARIVLSPNEGVSPRLDIAFPIGWYRSCAGLIYPRLFVLAIPMPRLRWRTGSGPLYVACYKVSSRFWHNVDGRYGWRGSCRKAAR